MPGSHAESGNDASNQVLQRLRDSIRGIERRSTSALAPDLGGASAPGNKTAASAWTLGEPNLDALIGSAGLEFGLELGLESGGVHEIKPVDPQSGDLAKNLAGDLTTADWLAVSAATRRFALALGIRWLASCDPLRRQAPVLWCASAGDAAELGSPYGPGLVTLGIDPRRLIVVEPARASQALWAIEEGLKANALALVIGQLPSIGLTPARRLSLAAAAGRTPCLLLTHPRSPAVAATATRWRIAPAPSAPNPLDPEAPGAARFLVTLERCRGRPLVSRSQVFRRSGADDSVSVVLEWCDAAFRFRLASGLAAGAFRSGQSERGQKRAA